MLLERCEPGTALRDVPEREQDLVIAGLLRRLWSKPSAPHPFRPVSVMLAHWATETSAAASKWIDAGLVREGLRLFEELAEASFDDVLLATDLHAGNVLRAEREPWLAIDPKPYVGDRAYDATQHLFNCKERMCAAPDATICPFADFLEVDHERVRMWMFARSAAEPRKDVEQRFIRHHPRVGMSCSARPKPRIEMRLPTACPTPLRTLSLLSRRTNSERRP